MTAITSTARDVATATAPPDTDTGAGFVTATVQSARRTVLQFLRTPQLFVLPTVTGALFLFVFRYIFGGAITTGSRVDYVDFVVPGFVLTSILWTGMNAPAGVAEDAASGVHDRFRSLPIPRGAVVAGRALADGALNTWTLFTTAVLGFAVGFRTDASIGAIVLAFAVMLVATYAFTWFFVSLGLGGQRPSRAGHVDLARRAAHVPVERVRAGRLDARLVAADREQPAGDGDGQRRAQPHAGRCRRGRGRPHERLLGGAQPRVVRGHRRRVLHVRGGAFRPHPLTLSG
jgi:ABC-2 family transporter